MDVNPGPRIFYVFRAAKLSDLNSWVDKNVEIGRVDKDIDFSCPYFGTRTMIFFEYSLNIGWNLRSNQFTLRFKYAIIKLYKWIRRLLVSVSSEIKDIRRKCLLNQTKFANSIGVSFSTVNRWENEKAIPNYKALKKIKDFCEKNDIPFEVDSKVWEEKE